MWINESKNRLFFDMHLPDWPERQCAQHFDPQEIADTFEKSHIDSVILYAKCQFGNAYFDTKTGKKHSGLGELDLFREVTKRLHEKGIKVIAYYSVAWDELQAKEHPEWLVEGADGIRGSGGEYRWSTLCINSPYRELVKAHLAEITEELSPDGFWIDMTIIGGGRCYCPNCRDKYKQRFGENLIPNTDDLAAKNRFVRFRYDYIEEFYQEIYEMIRAIKPDCQISNNYWGYPYSNSSNGSRAVGALTQCDYITGEAYTDWTGLSAPGFFSKWLRSVAEGRPFEALIGRFTGTWDYTTKPAVQMALEGYTIASNGGTVTLDDMPFADGGIDKELYEDIGKMFSKIDERRSYLDGDFLKHTAIFHSLVTKDMYFEGKECFIAPIVGAYRMCKEMGCPAEFVFDENLKLEKLKDYSVVLMPSVAVLSEEHAEMLQSYLREGGLVVAAGEFAAYEEKKDRLVDSDVLEKLTGLKREGLSDYTLSYFKLEENAYANHISHRPITVRSRYVKYQGANASEIKAWVINPICETTEKVFFHNNIPSPYERTDYPAVLSIPVGKGTLVLFAQDIFAQFSRYHQLEIKKVMENILTVHQKTPKVRFSCASNVETAVSIKDGKMILQLVNFNPGMTVCTGQMDCFEAKYPRTFEFVESIQKLHDIEIIMDYPVERAYAVEQNKELEIKRTDTETKIVLDVLSEWETIVVDLK